MGTALAAMGATLVVLALFRSLVPPRLVLTVGVVTPIINVYAGMGVWFGVLAYVLLVEVHDARR